MQYTSSAPSIASNSLIIISDILKFVKINLSMIIMCSYIPGTQKFRMLQIFPKQVDSFFQIVVIIKKDKFNRYILLSATVQSSP